jgi:TPR repeat protein
VIRNVFGYILCGDHMHWWAVFALLLLFSLNAQAQSGAFWRFALEFGEAVAAGVVANYATDHLRSYTATWGASGTPEGNYKEGLEKWRAGMKEDAKALLTKSANSGYSKAQSFLADLAMHDLDYSEARKWYIKAADHDDAWSEFQLGNLAYHGLLGGADYSGALNWYRRAASLHDSRADLMLVEVLTTAKLHPGQPTAFEWTEATNALRDAANQGSGAAQASLGYIYAVGAGGVRVDFCEALKWTRLAAEKQVPGAVRNVGVAYENGDCLTSRDRMHALQCYRRAAALGDSASQNDIARLQPELTAEINQIFSGPQSTNPRLCDIQGRPPVYDLNGHETTWPGNSSNNAFGLSFPIKQDVYAFAESQDFLLISRSSWSCGLPFSCVLVAKANITCSTQTRDEMFRNFLNRQK